MAEEKNTELAVELAMIKKDIQGISGSLENIFRQLDSLLDLRKDLTRVTSESEQQAENYEELSRRMLSLEQAVIAISEKRHKADGVALAFRIIGSIVAGALISGVGYLINAYSDIKVLQHQVAVLSEQKQAAIKIK